jgi:hypothetical protein
MFCGCWVPNVAHPLRLIDLDPRQVAALGLDPADGLWRVRVERVSSSGIPDTALEEPR